MRQRSPQTLEPKATNARGARFVLADVEAHGLLARSPCGLFNARADRKSLGLILLLCGVLFLRLVSEFIKQFEIVSDVEGVSVGVWICADEVGLSDIGSGFDLEGFCLGLSRVSPRRSWSIFAVSVGVRVARSGGGGEGRVGVRLYSLERYLGARAEGGSSFIIQRCSHPIHESQKSCCRTPTRTSQNPYEP